MNETGTLTITEFLRDRIAEDEADMQMPGHWDSRYDETGSRLLMCDEQGNHVGMAPARALAECEAKRRIVERHHHKPFMSVGGPQDWCACLADWPCPDLLSLASVYADHKDYQQAWRADS